MGNKPVKPKKPKDAKPVTDPTRDLIGQLSNLGANATTLTRLKSKPLPKPQNENMSEKQRIEIIKLVQNGLPPPPPLSPPGHQQTLQSLSDVDSNDNIVIAMYAYKAQNTGDLSFRKGEKLEVVEKNDPDWWTVKRIETGEIGYIPANYVGTTAIESEE